MRTLTAPLVAVFAAALCGSAVLSQEESSGSGLQPGYTPVCDERDFSRTPNPPIPALPDQFSTVIEFSIDSNNSTFIFSEHYDDPGNRGRVDTVGITGERDVVIYNFNDGEAFVIPDRERGVACGVQPLTDPSEFVNTSFFGFRYVNGSIHIGSVTAMFDLADNQTGQYCGRENMRGIPCDCWQTCHASENRSYLITYYFAATAQWNYYYPGDAIPVRIHFYQTRMDYDGFITEDRHVYNIFAFHSGPNAVPDSVFEVPTGLPCLGRAAGRALPDLPPYFSMMIEAVDNPDTVRARREFYDTQLFRVDFVDDDTPYSVIHDFELGVQYIIDRSLSQCKVKSLANATSSYDVIIDQSGTTRLRTPTEFFRLGTSYNFSYEGSTRIRGIDADAWISVRDSFPLSSESRVVNGTVELFYSHAHSNISSLYSTVNGPIPLAINLTGTFCSDTACTNSAELASYFLNIYNFFTEEPDFDVFDTSLCASPGQYEILSLIIPGHESGSGIWELRRAVRLGLTNWANLPALQVSDIKILGENGTHIFVTLQIIPIPTVARYSNPQSPRVIMEMILNQTTPDDRLPFTIQLPPDGESVRPFLLRVNPDCPFWPPTPTSSTTTSFQPPTPSTTTGFQPPTPSTSTGFQPPTPSTSTGFQPPTPSTSTGSSGTEPTECPSVSSGGSGGSRGVSSGTAAALCIVMFLVGMICAMVLVLVVRWLQSRRKRFNLITGKYRRQENEMEGFTD